MCWKTMIYLCYRIGALPFLLVPIFTSFDVVLEVTRNGVKVLVSWKMFFSIEISGGNAAKIPYLYFLFFENLRFNKFQSIVEWIKRLYTFKRMRLLNHLCLTTRWASIIRKLKQTLLIHIGRKIIKSIRNLM